MPPPHAPSVAPLGPGVSPGGRRTALVTGSNGGIGRALAKRIAAEGWRVLLHGRDADKLERARRTLGVEAADALRADLQDVDAVRRLARDVRQRTDRLDVLVHNAGALRPRLERSPQGIEVTAAVNALAPFVLTNALRPLLEQTARDRGGARVVTVSSQAQRARGLPLTDASALADVLRGPAGGYSPVRAYGYSKFVATAWTLELARRLVGTGVTAHACHPGVVRTGIFWGLGGPAGLFASLFSFLYLPPSRGAASPHLLATNPRFGRDTGRWVTRGHLRGPHETDPPRSARSPDVGAVVWDALSRLAGEPDTG